MSPRLLLVIGPLVVFVGLRYKPFVGSAAPLGACRCVGVEIGLYWCDRQRNGSLELPRFGLGRAIGADLASGILLAGAIVLATGLPTQQFLYFQF